MSHSQPLSRLLRAFVLRLFITALLLTATVCAALPVLAAPACVKVTGGSVNVRSGAGASYTVIDSVYQNEIYACLAEKKDASGQNWYQIALSGSRKGWITGKYAKDVTAATQTVQITGNTVNVRTGCGTDYPTLGIAVKGAAYGYLGNRQASDDTVWYRIRFSANSEGWVSGRYSILTAATGIATTTTAAVSPTQIASATSPTAPPLPTGTIPQPGKYVRVTASSAVAHVTPGHSAKVAGQAAKGKTFPYIESYTTAKKNIWYKVRFTDDTIAWLAQTDSCIITETPALSDAQKALNRIAQKYGAVGVQVAVIKNGTVTDTYEYGYAVKNSVPMTASHKIRIASISKVAVAMNAMKMREEGIIDLDENIGAYWQVKPYRKTTLRQLLTHTSYLRDNGYSGTRSGTAKQLTASSSFRSSNAWSYNNYAVGLAGSTLEVAAGQHLNSYAADRFFTPLGIDASFTSGDLKNPAKLAALYYPSDSVARSVASSKSFHQKAVGGNTAYFAGGLTISARDMGKLTGILAGDGVYQGTRYLSKESVALMEPSVTSGYARGHSFSQCMPLRYQTNLYGQKKLYYHLGTAYGTLSFMGYNPDTKNGVVILSTGAFNGYDSRGTFCICADLADYFLNH